MRPCEVLGGVLGFVLPVCVTAVSGAALRGRAHGRGLAGDAHRVSLAQVLHPARVRTRLQGAVLGKGFCPELHAVSAQKEKYSIIKGKA